MCVSVSVCVFVCECVLTTLRNIKHQPYPFFFVCSALSNIYALANQNYHTLAVRRSVNLHMYTHN